MIYRQIAARLQLTIEVVKQPLDHPRLRQLLAIQPYRLGIRNRVFQAKTQKADER